METNSVQKLLDSEDPLSNEAFEFLLEYKEEDSLIDYKEDFHFQEEKEWLGITKDIMAFANTYGGYLIFGVRDGTFSITGLDESVTKLLTDTNKVMQKINRHIDPPISLLRSKEFVKNGKRVVGLLIPVSVGITHLISKDGSFTYPSGTEKVILRKGTIYVRRSAGNHLADARDIDGIISRRLGQFREDLLDKIVRVVEAPPKSEVFVVSSDPNTETKQSFIIHDGPEAIPVKGMSFTVAPETLEQKIAAWVAMSSEDKNAIPSNPVLWTWYNDRHSIHLSEKHRVEVARFCMLSNVPFFFWLQECKAHLIKDMVRDAITNKLNATQIDPTLNIAAFLGKRFYNSVLRSLGNSKMQRREYPVEGPKSLFSVVSIEAKRNRNKLSEEILRQELDSELTEIAAKLGNRKKKKVKDYSKLVWQAYNIDCYLYAQDDKYDKQRN